VVARVWGQASKASDKTRKTATTTASRYLLPTFIQSPEFRATPLLPSRTLSFRAGVRRRVPSLAGRRRTTLWT
jgi:hypothetical protein